MASETPLVSRSLSHLVTSAECWTCSPSIQGVRCLLLPIKGVPWSLQQLIECLRSC